MSKETQETIMKSKYCEMENSNNKKGLKIVDKNKKKILAPPEKNKPDYGSRYQSIVFFFVEE